MSSQLKPKFNIHALITIVLMFGISFLPPFGELTDSGIKILGILIAMVYGITTCGGYWPCILGMAAMPLLGVAPISQVLSTGVGSDALLLMLFFFIFVDVLSENKITEVIAEWILSRKIVIGRPWLYSYFLIIGTMLAGAFGSSFPAMLVFWSVLISTCKLHDIKPYEKYPTLMFIGIALGGLASSSTWLFRGNPLFVNATLKQISEGAYELNFGAYAFFSFLIWFIIFFAYIGFCKYVLRIDVSSLADIGKSSENKKITLNKKQKYLFFYTTLVLVVYCFIGFTPAQSPLGQYFSTLGVSVPIFLITVLMLLTKVDGEPLMDFQKSAKNGVIWETFLLAGSLLSVATIMMTTETGVAESLLAGLNPIFQGHGFIFITVVIVIISIILTNFLANTTVGLMFTPVLFALSVKLGVNPIPAIALLTVSIHIAYLTPAASPFAALLFGYSTWVKKTDLYKYGLMTIILLAVITLGVGLPLSYVLF